MDITLNTRDLTPDDQAKFFEIMRNAHKLSTDKGLSQDVPDQQAQQGVSPDKPSETAGVAPDNSVDYSKIQSLFRDTTSGSPIAMQEGDKLHPQDAIDTIHEQMFGPAKPQGVEKATGQQLTTGANGQLQGQVPNHSAWGQLLGLKKTMPVTGQNFFQAAQQAKILDFLPGNAPRMPDGTPFVTEDAFKTGLEAKKGQVGLNMMVPLDQAKILGIVNQDQYDALTKAGVKEVPQRELGTGVQAAGVKVREGKLAVDKLNQAFKFGGAEAAQPMVEVSYKNIGLITRAEELVKQIEAKGGVAVQRQRAELASILGSVAGQNSGVLTDQRMNEYMPQSAKAKFGNFASYWLNEDQPQNFTGFLPQMKDLLMREKEANREVAKNGIDLGLNIMGMTQPGQARSLATNVQNNPLFGGTQALAPNIRPPQAATPPPTTNLTDPMSIRAAFQAGKITRDQAKAFLNHRGK